VLACFSL